VVLAITAGLAGLAAWDAAQGWASLLFLADALLSIAPFLLISVLLAAFIKATGADKVTSQVFSGRQSRMIGVAALFGALSPFCSCGVVPLIASLLVAGVPLAPVMAFWIASPVMDPQIFVLTAAEIGLGFAVAKTLIAIGLGLTAGFATLALARRGRFQHPLRPSVAGSAGSGPSEVPLLWRFWEETPRRQSFLDTAGKNAWLLGRWLALAFLIESLMVAYLPPSSLVGWLGDGDILGIAAATAVGVPAYLNGFAAIPLVARLMAFGMAPGAAMAFMVAGGVTSIPAAMAVAAISRRAVFLWYLFLALFGSFGFALLYQATLS